MLKRRGRTQLLALHWTENDAAGSARKYDRALSAGRGLQFGMPDWAKGVRVRRVGPMRNVLRGRTARVTWVVEATEWKGHR